MTDDNKFSVEDIKKMNKDPIVFMLTAVNPLTYETAMRKGVGIYASFHQKGEKLEKQKNVIDPLLFSPGALRALQFS